MLHPDSAKKIFVSNRLPFSLQKETGHLIRGSGGLVSALLGVSKATAFSWFGFESSNEDHDSLKQKVKAEISNLDLHPVFLNKNIYDSYYDKFSNDVLWPLFHYEGQLTSFRQTHWKNYKKANQTMADAILKEAKKGDTVWIHDFHFLLLPQMLREKNPDLKIGFFLHIPFPTHEIFRQLPVRTEVLEALTACDLIGFHEHSYLRHFTVALKTHLGINTTLSKATYKGHTFSFGVFPISVDTEGLKEKAKSPEVAKASQDLTAKIKEPYFIIGVDRLDYTKGLELKLQGFRRALQKYPELRGKISLLQVAIPTRAKVPSYIKLRSEVEQLVGQINGEFGTLTHTPIHYIYNSVSETELLALYRSGHSALITSKRDGMNLVAMEYAIAQSIDHPGVLIVSEFAGVASFLSNSISINPWDEDSVADAIFKAFQMPFAERKQRLTGLQEFLGRYSASEWAENFLSELSNTSMLNRKSTIELSSNVNQWPETMIEKMKQALKIRLFLDYDGTLVKIAATPDQAIIQKDTLALLRNLNQHHDVYILSGRPKEFLDSQFKNENFSLVAEHGGYFKKPHLPWQNRVNSDLSQWYKDAEHIMEDYAKHVPLSFVEKKEACLVWHYRKSPEEFANAQAKKLQEELQVSLSNQPMSVSNGSKIIEAKAIECNKGYFLRSLLQNEHEALNICIGDDRTDEDAFSALGQQDITIKIGTGPTLAEFRISDQTQVTKFLENLIQFRKEKNPLIAPYAG